MIYMDNLKSLFHFFHENISLIMIFLGSKDVFQVLHDLSPNLTKFHALSSIHAKYRTFLQTAAEILWIKKNITKNWIVAKTFNELV
jgi:hypothetical protein